MFLFTAELEINLISESDFPVVTTYGMKPHMEYGLFKCLLHRDCHIYSFIIFENRFRGGSKTAAISKMERFVIIVNAFQPFTIISEHSILDVTAVLDPSLWFIDIQQK